MELFFSRRVRRAVRNFLEDSQESQQRRRRNEISYPTLKGEDGIRLLELSPGNDEQPIQCNLKLARVSERPLYSAVSYTWGDPEPSHIIEVNAQSFRVRDNLFQLLSQLRHPEHKQTLWIDALCINQMDGRERSAQVRKMAEIFSTAVQVIAWLRDYPVGTEGRMISDALTPDFIDKYSSFQMFHIRKGFFAHEYWRRRWIIQEIALAHSVTLFCGRNTAPLAHVKNLTLSEQHQDALAYRLCLLQETTSNSKSTLAELLSDYEETQCQDDRDKIYALLSLTSGAAGMFPISYEMTRLDLLSASLGFSSAVQAFNSVNTVNFALALSKQLGMSQLHWEPAEHHSLFEGMPDEQVLDARAWRVRSVLFTHGVVVQRTAPTAELHKSLESYRERLAPLNQYSKISLKETNLPESALHKTYEPFGLTRQMYRSGNAQQISPRDLYAFVWQPLNSIARIGFATTRTERSDLVCRFVGTDVAIVLRGSPKEYAIVGRAWLGTHIEDLAAIPSLPEIEQLYGSPSNRPRTELIIYTQGTQHLDLIRLARSDH